MQAKETAPAAAPLPALRQELRLLAGPHGNGQPDWLIYDPVRHRYFHVSKEAFQLLELWRAEPIGDFAARARIELDRSVDPQEVSELAKFLITSNLALEPPSDDPRLLATQEVRTHKALIWRVVHGYLFFTVPIVRPERFLKSTLPFVEPLFSRTAALVLALISIVGLYFASRQWDLFVATFLDFFSLEGAAVYAVTLIAVKTLHELGHAYAATRAGVRVNTMGIAFMVMMPILYTDVTDAWRLRRRRDKLAIDGAGIFV